MTRTISFITVVGAALALAAPALGQGAQYSFERPQWQQALEARSEGMNKKYGLGDYDPAIRALKLRSEELNRQHGLGEYSGSAYPASSILIGKALDNPVSVAGKDASDRTNLVQPDFGQNFLYPGGYPQSGYGYLGNPPASDSAVGSGSEIEWPQVGIGLGIGALLMIGLYLAVKGTRQRTLAH